MRLMVEEINRGRHTIESLSPYTRHSLDEAAQHLEQAVSLYTYPPPELRDATAQQPRLLQWHWKNYHKPPVTEFLECSTFRTTAELVNPDPDYRQTVNLFRDETKPTD